MTVFVKYAASTDAASVESIRMLEQDYSEKTRRALGHHELKSVNDDVIVCIVILISLALSAVAYSLGVIDRLHPACVQLPAAQTAQNFQL